MQIEKMRDYSITVFFTLSSIIALVVLVSMIRWMLFPETMLD